MISSPRWAVNIADVTVLHKPLQIRLAVGCRKDLARRIGVMVWSLASRSRQCAIAFRARCSMVRTVSSERPISAATLEVDLKVSPL
jgi:hypothetical protein